MTKGTYPSETYKGYVIGPSLTMDPIYNKYQVYVLAGPDVLAVIDSFTWRSAVEDARKYIDKLPARTKPSAISKSYTETQKLHLADLAGLKPHNITAEEKIKEQYESKPYIATESIVKKKQSQRMVGEPELYLNQEIYDRDYKPKGWHLLIIGPTATWRQEWHEWEAIRDIVQNALDEGEAYTFGDDGRGLWIADSGRGINISDFLLGPAKLKPDYARGKFGEGMKVSALVLTRLGYRVHVRTSDKDLWICYYQQEVGSGKTADTLAALWKESAANTGTKFNIIGYHGSSFEELFAINIPPNMIKQSTPAKLEGTINRFNRIYRTDQDYPPVIYCRDIYLQKIQSKYSYNLWGFDLSPDRHGPKNESDVAMDIGRTWAYVKDQSMLEDLFKAFLLDKIEMTYEKYHVNFSRWYMGTPADTDMPSYMSEMEANKSVWSAAFKAVAGKNAVIRTDSKYDGMAVHLGYKSISLPYDVSTALQMIIPTDISVVKNMIDELRGTKIIPDKELTYSQMLNLTLARQISRVIVYSDIKVYAAIIPNIGSETGFTEGFYDTVLKEIYLLPSVIEKGSSTVDVIIHEAAHASVVFRMVSKGDFDKILKDPNFVWD
jgi:hypothetical protein